MNHKFWIDSDVGTPKNKLPSVVVGPSLTAAPPTTTDISHFPPMPDEAGKQKMNHLRIP